jgi:hypothetical protein
VKTCGPSYHGIINLQSEEKHDDTGAAGKTFMIGCLMREEEERRRREDEEEEEFVNYLLVHSVRLVRHTILI